MTTLANKATIDGRDYTFLTIPPTEAFPLLLQVFGSFGKPLIPVVMKETEADSSVIASLLDIFSQTDSHGVLALFRLVLKYVRHEDAPVDIDESFHGRNKELLRVFFYALAFNFSDFLGESLLTFATGTLLA